MDCAVKRGMNIAEGWRREKKKIIKYASLLFEHFLFCFAPLSPVLFNSIFCSLPFIHTISSTHRRVLFYFIFYIWECRTVWNVPFVSHSKRTFLSEIAVCVCEVFASSAPLNSFLFLFNDWRKKPVEWFEGNEVKINSQGWKKIWKSPTHYFSLYKKKEMKKKHQK